MSWFDSYARAESPASPPAPAPAPKRNAIPPPGPCCSVGSPVLVRLDAVAESLPQSAMQAYRVVRGEIEELLVRAYWCDKAWRKFAAGGPPHGPVARD